MKGKLPVTEKIIFEDKNENLWRMLSKKLINEIKINAIVEAQIKMRIRLVINKVVSPESRIIENSCTLQQADGLNKQEINGFEKSRKFLLDCLDKTTWYFVGYIDGEEKVPIFITYYQSIDMCIYTQKLKGEKNENFFPDFVLN